MTDTELCELGRSDIFETLSDEDLRDVGRLATVLEFAPGYVILTPESQASATYFVLEGCVKLFQMSEEGREVTVEVLHAGNVFGRFSQDDDDEEGVWAETVEPSKLAVMQTSCFAQLLTRHPSVALDLIATMRTRLARRESQIEDLALRDVPSRVASALLKLAEEHGTMGSDGVTINLHLTHQDIANLVAATRESVTHVLGEMRRQRIIEIADRRVRIAQPDGLRARARLT